MIKVTDQKGHRATKELDYRACPAIVAGDIYVVYVMLGQFWENARN